MLNDILLSLFSLLNNNIVSTLFLSNIYVEESTSLHPTSVVINENDNSSAPFYLTMLEPLQFSWRHNNFNNSQKLAKFQQQQQQHNNNNNNNVKINSKEEKITKDNLNSNTTSSTTSATATKIEDTLITLTNLKNSIVPSFWSHIYSYRPHSYKNSNSKKISSSSSSSFSMEILEESKQIPINKCEKLTSEEKYAKLEKVGGKNQQFMANSPVEASRNFPQLLSSYTSIHSRTYAEASTNFFDKEDANMLANWEAEKRINDDFENNEINGDYCDKSCLEIRTKLNEALNSRQNELKISRSNENFIKENEKLKQQIPILLLNSPNNDEYFVQKNSTVIQPITTTTTTNVENMPALNDNSEEFLNSKDEDDKLPIRNSYLNSSNKSKIKIASKNSIYKEINKKSSRKKKFYKCFLETFIPIGNCTSHGEEETWGHEKLCTACRGVYLLNKECFPTFLNAVICDRTDIQCIFDRTGTAQGKCQTKTLSFKVMRNRGSEECEEWIFEYLDVPVACECYLSKKSWLEALPPQ